MRGFHQLLQSVSQGPVSSGALALTMLQNKSGLAETRSGVSEQAELLVFSVSDRW